MKCERCAELMEQIEALVEVNARLQAALEAGAEVLEIISHEPENAEEMERRAARLMPDKETEERLDREEAEWQQKTGKLR